MKRKFKIAAINIEVSASGLTDVVDTINWVYQLKDTKTHEIVETYGLLKLPQPNPETFIPLESLTEGICVEWILDNLDVTQLDILLDGKMDKLKNPETKTITNPFTT